MYVFKSSFLRARNSKDGYRNINVANMTMNTLLNEFVDGYLVLTHNQITGTFYLTIKVLRNIQAPMFTNMTFNQWVTQNNTVDLNLTKVKPVYTQSEVLYSDAIRAGFNIDRVGRYLPVNANISNADKVDLLLRKNIPNQNLLYTRIITTVNGFTHRTFSHEDGIALAGAGETFNNSGINTVGVLSFLNACDLRQYEITDNMLTPSTSTMPLYKELLINLGTSLHNKSVMLSIGGHLMLNNDVVDVVNPEAGIILVKLAKLNILKMILGSVGIINLDALGIFATNKGTTYNKVRVNDVTADICIRRYMCIPQSFVIVADTQSIQTEYHDISPTGIPGSYETKNEPLYPLITSQGLMPEYWRLRNEEQWSIKLTDDITKRRMHTSNIFYNNEIINSISPTYKWYYDDPKLMKIIVTSNK